MRNPNVNTTMAALLAGDNQEAMIYLGSLIQQNMHPLRAVRNEAWESLCELVHQMRNNMSGHNAPCVRVKANQIKRMASRGGIERAQFINDCVRQALHEDNDTHINALTVMRKYFEAAATVKDKRDSK
ncbi:hypothetical protein [Vibrio algivorus]|uniref:Uncharacterized protein n=1 Tax=Vibrio algivorus TaxID=1667024 RepID=A0ABQ6EQZ6_9VIBR|nr:hypothetical protein [Vibrio algivorus]GLT15005.1 hypothetical protein GCM10007931_19800 [Vibrio algivorus]